MLFQFVAIYFNNLFLAHYVNRQWSTLHFLFIAFMFFLALLYRLKLVGIQVLRTYFM